MTWWFLKAIRLSFYLCGVYDEWCLHASYLIRIILILLIHVHWKPHWFWFKRHVFDGLNGEKCFFYGRLHVFEFLDSFAFPFLKDVVVFLVDFWYPIDGSFTLGLLRIGGFKFVAYRRVTYGKYGLVGFRLWSWSFYRFID